MHTSRPNFLLLLASFVFIQFASRAQTVSGVTGQGPEPVVVQVGELQTISDALPVRKKLKKPNEFENNRRMLNHPGSPAISAYPGGGNRLNDVASTQSVHSNFQAISSTESGYTPPDCVGDVSETQICIAANGRIKFYAKPTVCDAALTTVTTASTNTLGSPQVSVDMDVLFNSVRNNSSTTDPTVYWDRLTSRWFIVCINTTSFSNRILVAVSNSATVTAASAFTLYYFTHDQGLSSGANDYQTFADYPMVGLDKNALYVGVLIFGTQPSAYQGSSLYVIKKSSLLSGGSLTFTAFRRIGKSTSGIYGPNPAFNDDPQATKGYFVGVDAANYGVLDYVIVNDPGGTPTTTTGTFNVPETSGPITQVAKGSNKPLDAADDRLLNVQMMKNKVTGIQTIWTSQNLAVTTAGTASTNGTNLRNAVRWYELTVSATAVGLKQAGTIYDNATTNPQGYWMGSIAGSGQGHALAGASTAGTNLTPNVVIAGRYSSQTQGELASPVAVTTSTAAYNAETGEKQRWGDYSQTVVDPSDNMTMWTFQEYSASNNVWGERAIQVKAPAPATPTGLSPINCGDTRTADVTLTGSTNNNYSGFFDPGDDAGGPGFTKHLKVSSTGNVSVSNVKFDSPTQIRFTLNFANATLGSQQTLTITNPDCQSVTYNYTLPSSCTGGTVTTKLIEVKYQSGTNVPYIVFGSAGGTLRIIDMAGRVLYSQVQNSTQIAVPAFLVKGVYVLQYINGDSKGSTKLLVP